MLLFPTKQQNKWEKKHLNSLNSDILKVGLKTNEGKTKYMTNHAGSEDMLTDQEKNEEVTEFKYLGQTTHKRPYKRRNLCQDQSSMELFWGKKTPKEIPQDRKLPISLKKQVMDQCVLPAMTYGCQTWSLNKQLTNKLKTAQRAMERKMLGLNKLQDKIPVPCSEIRKRRQIIDIIEYTLKQVEMDQTYSKNEGQ